MNKGYRSKQSHGEREDESIPKEWTSDSYLNNLIEWISNSDLHNLRTGERFKAWYQPLQDFRCTWSISKFWLDPDPCQVSSRNHIYIMMPKTLDPIELFLETSRIFSLLKWA
jgi:hypothetical protein